MEINYKGRKVNTKNFDGTLEREKIDYIRNTFYKPNYEKAIKELKKILKDDGFTTTQIYKYWFEKIANDGIHNQAKWSINEMLNSDELIQTFINKTKLNEKVFTSNDLMVNVKKSIDLGGAGLSKKLTNFPFKECKRIINKYCKGNVYIDTSAGWGIRMLASAALDINYVGFDINPLLISSLKELAKEIKKINPHWKYKLFDCGSEKFQDELFNKSDFIFTSPPYFNLENYIHIKDGELNIENMNYNEWLKQYVEPLLNNCNNYAKPNTYIAFNIKDFKGNNLVKDFENIGKKVGLIFDHYDSLTNKQRIEKDGKLMDNSEKIVIFKKGE